MTEVELFQRDIVRKMNSYFRLKIEELQRRDDITYLQCVDDYIRQQECVLMQDNQHFRPSHNYQEVLLRALYEVETKYYSNDFNENIKPTARIYSPRADIAFTPAIKKRSNNSGYKSIGVKRLTEDVVLYKKLNQLHFIRELEILIRNVSNENMSKYNLEQNHDSLYQYNEYNYLNKRPLLLFGFEIENSRTIKYLMGDFLNILSIARIPTVIVRESTLIDCMNMLMYCSTIRSIKEVPIYDLLKKVNVLTVSQIRNLLNKLLNDLGLEEIGVINYK